MVVIEVVVVDASADTEVHSLLHVSANVALEGLKTDLYLLY